MISVAYSAVSAKARAWFSSLIDEDSVPRLLDLSENELFDWIKQNEKRITAEVYDLNGLEAALKQSVVSYVQSALRYVNGGTENFLHIWLISYEIENLKMICRSILSGKKLDFLYEVFPHSKIRLENAKDLGNFDEFLDLLARTPYYKLAATTLPRVKEEQNSLFWEIQLDNDFARKLKDSGRDLSSKDQKAVREMLFYSMEMSRMLWLYRLRFQYQMGIEDALSFVPNVLKILDQKRYLELASVESPESFFSKLEAWHLIRHSVSNIGDCARAMNNEVIRRARSYLVSTPFSIGLVIAFIVLKSQNIRAFIMLLEGKRHKMEKEDLRKLLPF